MCEKNNGMENNIKNLFTKLHGMKNTSLKKLYQRFSGYTRMPLEKIHRSHR